MLQVGDELLFDCGNDFNVTSDVVQSNLEVVGLVEMEVKESSWLRFKFQVGYSSALQHTASATTG